LKLSKLSRGNSDRIEEGGHKSNLVLRRLKD